MLKMCAVKDRAMDAFMQPFAVPHNNMAIRGFQDEIRKSGSQMNAHPDDYDLYFVGDFDDSRGVFAAVEIPELLIRGKDCAEVA